MILHPPARIWNISQGTLLEDAQGQSAEAGTNRAKVVESDFHVKDQTLCVARVQIALAF